MLHTLCLPSLHQNGVFVPQKFHHPLFTLEKSLEITQHFLFSLQKKLTKTQLGLGRNSTEPSTKSTSVVGFGFQVCECRAFQWPQGPKLDWKNARKPQSFAVPGRVVRLFVVLGFPLIPWKTEKRLLEPKNPQLHWSWQKSSEASTSFFWGISMLSYQGVWGVVFFWRGVDRWMSCAKKVETMRFFFGMDHESWMIMIFFFKDVWETFDGEWIEFIPSWIESGYFYIVIATNIRFSCGDLLWESVTPKMTQRNLELTWMSTPFIQLYCWGEEIRVTARDV